MLRIVFALIAIVVGVEVVSWITTPALEEQEHITQLVDKYRQIQELDEVLYSPALAEIVRERTACSSLRLSLTDLEQCRQEYYGRVFLFAHSTIDSAPDRVETLRCITDCPSVQALCRGTQTNGHDTCQEKEIYCLDFCLDRYWRGAFSSSTVFDWRVRD